MQITGRDLEILRYVSRHGVVTAGQVESKFFKTASAAYRRLKALTDAGYLRHDRVLFGEPGVYRTTEPGARLADLRVTPARLDVASLAHQLAVVDISEGLLEEHPRSSWVSEREIRREGLASERDLQSGKLLNLGKKRNRTPDGMLVLEDGTRVAVEYEQKQKTSEAYERILSQLNPALREDYERVIFFFNSETALQRVRKMAEEYGLEEKLEFRSWEG